MNSLLIIFQSAPHSTAAGQEGLDAVLAAVGMDMDVALAFVDDGVFLLTHKVHSAASKLRNYTKGFAAVADLGIDRVYVDATSLAARSLDAASLIVAVEAKTQIEMSAIIRRHARVLTF